MEKAAIELAVKRFLATGIVDQVTEQELAAACDAEVQRISRASLKQALPVAAKFTKQARKHGGILESTAFRTQARVLHLSGNHVEALKAYLSARKLMNKDALVRSRIDRALIDVYMYLGDFVKAKKHAQGAISTFRRLKADSDLAQTRVNYANLLHRQDRHRDAEKLYCDAAAYFEKADNQVALARTLYNRANTLVQLFDLEQAEALYQRAITIWDANDYALDGNDSRYGLAWLRMLKGKFHVALMELAECEKVYREGGDPRGEALCNLDRAEVYLGLGLYEDALEAARKSEALFDKLNLRYERSKSALFRGQAAFALAKVNEARSALSRARSGFGAEKNNGFLGATGLLAADLNQGDTKSRMQSLRDARSHFNRGQLPLWEAICDLQDANYPTRERSALARLEKNAAVKAVPHLFAIWETVRGDYEFRRGDIAEARKHWKRAADRLDAVRAQLPPVELRSAFGKRQSSPHVRLIAADLESNPGMAAVWSERYKTAGIWSPISLKVSARQTRELVHESLDALARQVSSLAQQISGVGERGLSAVARNQAMSVLQRQIREQLIAVDRDHKQSFTNNDRLLEEMMQVSEKHPIVQFHLRDEDIIAFVHHRGNTSVGRIVNGRRRLADAMQRWRFVLEGELLAGHLEESMDTSLEQKLWSDLGAWLWAPLRVDATAETVILIPEGELANLPWRALIVDGQPLLERHNFVVSPSFRHYRAARQATIKSENIQVFRGKADDLPEVDRELENLVKGLSGKAEVFSPCGRKDWPDTGGARLWHFAGHALLRSDNPFYSYLALEDGALFAADFRLKQCRVHLVTLASCRSGEQVALPGEESTGLVRSLLEMGARNVIAGHWPVSDQTTALWMAAFYNRFFQGASILAAIRDAAITVRAQYPSAYHWGAFSVFGAGE
ncbi:MAG: CHAT domain-containing tetratricopeptide repeat protein [Candidatus Zixiibacteriota bacterium]